MRLSSITYWSHPAHQDEADPRKNRSYVIGKNSRIIDNVCDSIHQQENSNNQESGVNPFVHS